jgi:hypothetical protein
MLVLVNSKPRWIIWYILSAIDSKSIMYRFVVASCFQISRDTFSIESIHQGWIPLNQSVDFWRGNNSIEYLSIIFQKLATIYCFCQWFYRKPTVDNIFKWKFISKLGAYQIWYPFTLQVLIKIWLCARDNVER